MSSFDQKIKNLPEYGTPKGALIEVGDTCEFALAWFRDNGIKPEAADILTFTAMVFERWAEQREEARND